MPRKKKVMRLRKLFCHYIKKTFSWDQKPFLSASFLTVLNFLTC